MTLAGDARVEQARDDLDHLRTDIAAWLAHRRGRDRALGKHQTQLDVLDAALLTPLGTLREHLDALPTGVPAGEVYGACRAVERRAGVIRRVWLYYQPKLGQRDDTRLAPLLDAADEVVWSCYATPFQHRDLPVERGVAPLPYLDWHLAPEAVPRDRPPPGIGAGRDDELLARYLLRLPIPLVVLPGSAVHQPWWLVHLGHEVGHHLHYDLDPGWGAVARFGALLERLVPEPERQRWRSWGQELFADTVGVLAMGPPAARAVLELELADPAAMVATRPGYPPVVARLAWLASICRALGLDAALPGFDPVAVLAAAPDGRDATAARRDLDLAGPVAAGVLADTSVAGARLPELYGFDASDFRAGGTVAKRAWALGEPAALFPEQSLRAARLLAAGALAAWSGATAQPDRGRRATALASLAAVLPPALAASREEGTRAAAPGTTEPPAALGASLARFLLDEVT